MPIDPLSLPGRETLTPLQKSLSERFRFSAGCLSDADSGRCCCYELDAELWAQFVGPVLLQEWESVNEREWHAGDVPSLVRWLLARPARGTITERREYRRRYALPRKGEPF